MLLRIKNFTAPVRDKYSSMPKWLRRTIIIGLIVIIIVSIILATRSRGGVVPVQAGTTIQQDLERTVITSGRLKATNEQEFFTPVESTVMELNVKLGDRVKKGDVLGRLDSLELGRLYQSALATLASKKAELARAESQNDELSLQEAEADYIKAKNHLDRITALCEAGAIKAEELESAKSDFAKARTAQQQALVKVQKDASAQEKSSLRAQCDLAVQEVAQAKERLDMATFIAREDGVVITVGAKEGSRVMEGTLLLVVGNDKTLEVTANVNEIDAGSLQLGQPVKINCMSLPGRDFAGKVARIGEAATVQTSNSGEVVNVPVTVQLEGEQPQLKIGYTVDMTIKTMKIPSVVTVPIEALLERDGKIKVFVIKDNKLQERQITTKPGNELFDVVLEGLKPDEQVVLNPTPILKADQKVIIAPIGEKND